MIILLVVLALGVIIARSLVPKPRHGAALVASDDGNFHVSGKRISCSHCGGAEFTSNQILLNTWLLSLLRIDWLDASATVLTCKNCGKLTWFNQDAPDKKD